MVRAFPSFPWIRARSARKSMQRWSVHGWVLPPLSGISFFGSNKKRDTDEEQRERGEEAWKTGACCIFVFSTVSISSISARQHFVKSAG